MRAMSRALDDSLRPAPAGVAATAADGQARGWASRGAFGLGRRCVGLNQSTTLARRFLLASLVVLSVGGLAIGWWVGTQLERGIIDRSASITGLYVESFIAAAPRSRSTPASG